MKDGSPVVGKKITYNDKEWTVKEFYVVSGNPELYVGLTDNKVTINVRLSDIVKILTQ